MRRLLIFCPWLIVACAAGREGLDPHDGGATGPGGAGTSGEDPDGSTESEEDSGDADDGDESPPSFDVGSGMGGGGDEGHPGCRGIDFLFVVDNSGSMLDEQISLVTSFPGFVSEIEQTLEDDAKDFHVMVIDTDDGTGFDPFPPPGTCEAELGAGIVSDSTLYPCGFPDGRRYVTNADPNLPGAFGCAAYVGVNGSGGERPAQAMGRALVDLAGPDDCNEGFLRDDALLVVTFITDEEDDDSPGTPAHWLEPLIEAKDGDLESIVMLGLFDDRDLPNPVCTDHSAQQAPKLAEFVSAFGDRALRGSVCADSYDGFFAEAVGVIDQACSDFEPPG